MAFQNQAIADAYTARQTIEQDADQLIAETVTRLIALGRKEESWQRQYRGAVHAATREACSFMREVTHRIAEDAVTHLMRETTEK
jgi:hypothetical protein